MNPQSLSRFIRQPGPPAAERVTMVKAGARAIDVILGPGARLLDELSRLLLNAEVQSACLTLTGGAFGPFAYVIPALSPDATHAAFYSDTRRPAGLTRVDTAALTLGYRSGQPFFHCHALWRTADGRPGCGHVLPDETFIAAPIRVQGAGIIGARFEVHPDAETGFSLLTPGATGVVMPSDTKPAVALRLAPNQDLILALEQAGRDAGFAQAILQGGVASLIGARFEDAPPINAFATEMLVRQGAIRCTATSGKKSELDIAIVDLHGTIGTGSLVAGDNPVFITFEGMLVEA